MYIKLILNYIIYVIRAYITEPTTSSFTVSKSFSIYSERLLYMNSYRWNSCAFVKYITSPCTAGVHTQYNIIIYLYIGRIIEQYLNILLVYN